MPILKNAKKALRQSKKRQAENLIVKKAYKEAVKNAQKALLAGEKDAGEKVRLAQKKLDKAAKNNVLNKNTAGRKLSKLMSKVKTVAKK